MFVPHRVSWFVPACLALAVAGSLPASAGSFLQEPGAWQIISTTSLTNSRLKYDSRGALESADPYRKIETGMLVEYGLTRDLTLIANPVTRDVSLTHSDSVSAGHGLSSFEAGARWRMFDYLNGVVSFQALARASARSDAAFAFENAARTELRLGYGFPALINGKEGFVDSSIAWRKRREAQADEVAMELTYGWLRSRDRMVLIQYFTTLYPGAGFRQDPWQQKIQVSTVYGLNQKWSLQIGSFFTHGGHETRRERGSVMAVWRRF